MAQDYYDPLQVFDHIWKLLDDNKAELGIRYVAQFDEELLPEYPAVLLNMEGSPLQRRYHATGPIYLVDFNVDIWVLHALLTQRKSVRAREDIELATNVRKLLMANSELDGHIIDSIVELEQRGRAVSTQSTIVTTRLAWRGQNRVPKPFS